MIQPILAEAEAEKKVKEDVVLCIDDESNILTSLRRLLRREPYEVRTTEKPEEALQWVEEETISLVIADHRMAAMDGTDLLRRIAELSPTTIRIMLTGYSGNQQVRAGLRYEIQWLITKPWDDEALKRTIRMLLRRQKRRVEE